MMVIMPAFAMCQKPAYNTVNFQVRRLHTGRRHIPATRSGIVTEIGDSPVSNGAESDPNKNALDDEGQPNLACRGFE